MNLQPFHYAAIINSIKYIELEYKVKIHICGKIEHIFYQNKLLRYLSDHSFYDGTYCMKLKENKQAWNDCMKTKQIIINKLEENKKPFFETLPCGIGQYFTPIYSKEEIVGFISISGYRPERKILHQSLHNLSCQYGLEKKILLDKYNKQITKYHQPTTALTSLIDMLSLLFTSLSDELHLWNIAPNELYMRHQIFMQNILEYIQIHLNENITINNIATHLNCSKSYIQHIFKKYYNKTITDYIRNLRIEKAKTLLIRSNLSISEIASEVGYKDSNYFSTVFSKLNGKSPTEYRKKITSK